MATAAEARVGAAQVNPQEAALEVAKTGGRFDALANIAIITGLFDAAIGLLAAGIDHNPAAIFVGFAGYCVSVGAGMYLKRRGSNLQKQAEELAKSPQELPTISTPSPK